MLNNLRLVLVQILLKLIGHHQFNRLLSKNDYLYQMPRIMAFDYGLKRTGIAVTDENQIIASGLTTVPTKELLTFVKNYMKKESVEAFVLGLSLHQDGTENNIQQKIKGFAGVLNNNFPNIAIYFEDERFSSQKALETLIASGVPKQKRKNKALIDEVSATIILQSFMQTHNRT